MTLKKKTTTANSCKWKFWEMLLEKGLMWILNVFPRGQHDVLTGDAKLGASQQHWAPIGTTGTLSAPPGPAETTCIGPYSTHRVACFSCHSHSSKGSFENK